MEMGSALEADPQAVDPALIALAVHSPPKGHPRLVFSRVLAWHSSPFLSELTRWYGSCCIERRVVHSVSVLWVPRVPIVLGHTMVLHSTVASSVSW